MASLSGLHRFRDGPVFVTAYKFCEADANAKRRVAERDALIAAKAETTEGIAEEVAARIFRTGTARRSEIDRTVDKLDRRPSYPGDPQNPQTQQP